MRLWCCVTEHGTLAANGISNILPASKQKIERIGITLQFMEFKEYIEKKNAPNRNYPVRYPLPMPIAIRVCN